MKMIPLTEIETFDPYSGDIMTIIETPQGSQHRFKYDGECDLFMLNKVLSDGALFRFNWGFIPSTAGEDGYPLDVIVLIGEPVYTGDLVIARLVGVIEAEQEEKGKMTRNDRLLAVASKCQEYGDIRSLDDLNDNLVREIERFIECNNMVSGKFKPIGRSGYVQAATLLERGREPFQQAQKGVEQLTVIAGN